MAEGIYRYDKRQKGTVGNGLTNLQLEAKVF